MYPNIILGKNLKLLWCIQDPCPYYIHNQLGCDDEQYQQWKQNTEINIRANGIWETISRAYNFKSRTRLRRATITKQFKPEEKIIRAKNDEEVNYMGRLWRKIIIHNGKKWTMYCDLVYIRHAFQCYFIIIKYNLSTFWDDANDSFFSFDSSPVTWGSGKWARWESRKK